MDITWHGGSKMTLKTKKDVITIDHQQKESTISLYTTDQATKGVEPTLIDWPGEYEINESLFTGLPLARKNGELLTVFTMVVEDLTLCHLGTLDRKLTDKELEAIGNVDILFVPVGAKDTCLTPKEAKDVIEQIEPGLVVPMMDQIPEFLKEMGSNPEVQKKLNINKSKIAIDRTDVEVLEAQK